MPSNQKVAEVNFTIRISSGQDEFETIRREVSERISNFTSYGFESQQKRYSDERNSYQNTRILIENLAYRRFSYSGITKIYFTNYRESEGSFNIDFTLILLFISSYGSLRETVDYFISDIDFFFNRNLSIKDYRTFVSQNSNLVTGSDEANVDATQSTKEVSAVNLNSIKALIGFSILLSLFNLYLIQNVEKPLSSD